ncbi:hypothetical protein VTJ83DRAFT_1806 [Remersonia thermophila]|uniref:Choline dehydrogenase n=1 Tax=Remersonia thermophila TaxID=72144 RepID=A0ABR4DH87_9PEZI
MTRRVRTYLVAALALLASPIGAAPQGKGKGKGKDDGPAEEVFDYIVVGSGPGGAPIATNLAKAGYSVLLLEAGEDRSGDLKTSIISLAAPTINDSWDFYVRQHDDETVELKNGHLTFRKPDGSLWAGKACDAPAGSTLLGVNYPRGATLGGSSVVNAGVAVLPPNSDWDHIANLTGDVSWNAASIRNIFQQVEKNQYLPSGTPGHGFDGYLHINNNDGDIFARSQSTVDVLEAMVASIGDDPADTLSLVTRDINNASPTRDTTQGLFGLPFHVNETWGRSGARDLILATLAEKDASGQPKHPLTVRTNSLVTRVLFDPPGPGPAGQPKAKGVEYLEGASLYRADPRANPSAPLGTPVFVRARKEVILSAGVFNTPQLLLLSGIGPADHLAAHNISVLVDLPGVGSRLQDNPEFPIVGHSPSNQFFITYPLPGDPSCLFRFGPPGVPDPCVDAWLEDAGPYTRAGSNANAFLLATNHSVNGENDILVFAIPNYAFRGHWPTTAELGPNLQDPPGTIGLSVVKTNVQSQAGTVRLRSADPRDPPDINFRVFSGAGGALDTEAMADVVAWARGVFGAVDGPTGPLVAAEPPCSAGAGGSCRESDKAFIREQIFGHHATSTAAIGADGDPLAVLDSKFRVRGVKGLRVVDGSAFPRTPGSFPIVATFLISEKASLDVLADA